MTAATAYEQAQETITVLVCPVCGRDDRNVPFTGKMGHSRFGKKCSGLPERVTYRKVKP